MKFRLLMRWLWINAQCLLAAFGLTGILAWLLPQPMLAVYAGWATLLQAAGARNVAEFSSQGEMILHILRANSLTAALFVILGLVLQGPIVMVLTGIFYALISFLAPYAIGRPFGVYDWFLIAAEAFVLLLCASLASAVAGELFGVQASGRSVLEYWRSDWKRLLPRPVENWQRVLAGWAPAAASAFVIVAGVSVFVAWFETYGY
jgi:hypothetical protein